MSVMNTTEDVHDMQMNSGFSRSSSMRTLKKICLLKNLNTSDFIVNTFQRSPSIWPVLAVKDWHFFGLIWLLTGLITGRTTVHASCSIRLHYLISSKTSLILFYFVLRSL